MNHAARLNDWLQRMPPAEPVVVHELLALSACEWRRFTEQYPAPLRMDLTRNIIERAHLLLSRTPKDAVPTSRLAVLLAKSLAGVFADPASCDAAIDLEGDAWREEAHALLTVSDYDRAREAAEEAAFLYRLRSDERIPNDDGSLLSLILFQMVSGDLNEGTLERLERAAVLGLITGQILHGQGELADGLLLVEQSCNVLLSCCDQKGKYVQGRTIYAKMLAEQRSYTEALEVFERTAAVARELGDNETLAHLVNNIGYCYYHFLGNVIKAKECLQLAAQMFDDLGLAAEALRPRNELASLLIEEGRYSTAVSELYKSRQAYLDAGLLNEAAQVMLRIIRALVLAGRQADINWTEMESVLGRGGLRREAMRALQHLHRLASLRALNTGDMEDAEAMLLNLGSGGPENALPAEAG
ncbi:MAG: hypothetical protein ABI779_09190 [Acidobacteriota bacterium]